MKISVSPFSCPGMARLLHITGFSIAVLVYQRVSHWMRCVADCDWSITTWIQPCRPDLKYHHLLPWLSDSWRPRVWDNKLQIRSLYKDVQKWPNGILMSLDGTKRAPTNCPQILLLYIWERTTFRGDVPFNPLTINHQTIMYQWNIPVDPKKSPKITGEIPTDKSPQSPEHALIGSWASCDSTAVNPPPSADRCAHWGPPHRRGPWSRRCST